MPIRPERRRHVVYVTRHTEYHCRGRECVGVRDRKSGRWQRWHGVLRSRLVGCVIDEPTVQRRLEVGARLVFVNDGTFLTSKLERAARPPKNVLWSYSSLTRAGAIG
jgi:hypothetical protein